MVAAKVGDATKPQGTGVHEPAFTKHRRASDASPLRSVRKCKLRGRNQRFLRAYPSKINEVLCIVPPYKGNALQATAANEGAAARTCHRAAGVQGLRSRQMPRAYG